MDALTLGGSERAVIEVAIKSANGKQKVYKVPLAGSLTMADAKEFTKASMLPEEQRGGAYTNVVYELFCRYVGSEVIDRLTQDEFGILVEAWNKASDEAGADAGE